MKLNKIAILTSGGDAPGMNSAIQALTKALINKNIKPYFVYEGYKGLVENNIVEAKLEDIENISNRGGTILFSSRYPEFKDEKVRKIAKKNLEKKGIEALIVIGGDGTYKGSYLLSKLGVQTIALPGTIDNDIRLTDYTIGFYTALKQIIDSVSSIRDTHRSHNRIGIVEVMGRNSGFLALNAAIATSAEILSIPEKKLNEQEIINIIKKIKTKEKREIIILVTENLFDVHKLAKQIEDKTSFETKATILGHIQRGGTPASGDKILASRMAAFAIEELLNNKNGVAISMIDHKLLSIDIEKVVNAEREIPHNLIKEYEAIK